MLLGENSDGPTGSQEILFSDFLRFSGTTAMALQYSVLPGSCLTEFLVSEVL
jgi:hypothetical protein